MAECCQKVPIRIEDVNSPYYGQTFYVPCGKCANCLEHKQNEFLVRSYRAALYFGSFWMLSLTYRDSEVHIAGCLASFEGDEVESHSKPFLCDELRQVYLDKAPTAQYLDGHGHLRTYRLPFWIPCEKQNGYETKMHLQETYDKKDVANWIKQTRTTYERNFGKMPNFKYVVCPEYGSRTGRPHFHVCIYGLDSMTIYWMKSLWDRKHGYCDVKKVKHINDDSSDGFAKMSAYVSKYISKGLFESSEVSNGFVFKPRITSSRFLGLESSEYVDKLRTWHLAFDRVHKRYRVQHPFLAPCHFVDEVTGESVTFLEPASESVDLISCICERMYIDINGYKYPMPKSFKNVIYGTYSKTKSVSPHPNYRTRLGLIYRLSLLKFSCDNWMRLNLSQMEKKTLLRFVGLPIVTSLVRTMIVNVQDCE